MRTDVEEILERELHAVVDGLTVPPMPALPQESPSLVRRHWPPLLVAAALVLLVAGVLAFLADDRDGRDPQPAPPAPRSVPRVVPTMPYVLGGRLYVEGTNVPGTWWSVDSGRDGWVAQRRDNTWWWGNGPKAVAFERLGDKPPVLSPNGEYVGELVEENGAGVLTGFDTGQGGEGLGGIPIDLGDQQDGSAVWVRAVLDDGRIVAQGTETAVLWLPRAVDGSDSVDLSETAPGQVVVGNTAAGLVVTDGDGGTPYLAEISDAGELTRLGDLPEHDDLLTSPDAQWMIWTPAGTTGGEVTELETLEAGPVDGSRQVRLHAPDGWAFQVRQWAWESDDYLLAPVAGPDGERLARCSVELARCVLVDAD